MFKSRRNAYHSASKWAHSHTVIVWLWLLFVGAAFARNVSNMFYPTDQQTASAQEFQDPVCWNNILEPWEQCDDGNLNDGDGCSSSCEIEPRSCEWITVDQASWYSPHTVTLGTTPETYTGWYIATINRWDRSMPWDLFKNSTHTYTEIGTYTIQINIQATNPAKDRETCEIQIEVSSPLYCGNGTVESYYTGDSIRDVSVVHMQIIDWYQTIYQWMTWYMITIQPYIDGPQTANSYTRNISRTSPPLSPIGIPNTNNNTIDIFFNETIRWDWTLEVIATTDSWYNISTLAYIQPIIWWTSATLQEIEIWYISADNISISGSTVTYDNYQAKVMWADTNTNITTNTNQSVINTFMWWNIFLDHNNDLIWNEISTGLAITQFYNVNSEVFSTNIFARYLYDIAQNRFRQTKQQHLFENERELFEEECDGSLWCSEVCTREPISCEDISRSITPNQWPAPLAVTSTWSTTNTNIAANSIQRWDGNTTVITDQNHNYTHVYNTTWILTANLVIQNIGNPDMTLSCPTQVEVIEAGACTLDASPSEGIVPFTGTLLWERSPAFTFQYFDYGNGSTGTDANFIYTTTGTYTITGYESYTNASGDVFWSTCAVTVEAQECGSEWSISYDDLILTVNKTTQSDLSIFPNGVIPYYITVSNDSPEAIIENLTVIDIISDNTEIRLYFFEYKDVLYSWAVNSGAFIIDSNIVPGGITLHPTEQLEIIVRSNILDSQDIANNYIFAWGDWVAPNGEEFCTVDGEPEPFCLWSNNSNLRQSIYWTQEAQEGNRMPEGATRLPQEGTRLQHNSDLIIYQEWTTEDQTIRSVQDIQSWTNFQLIDFDPTQFTVCADNGGEASTQLFTCDPEQNNCFIEPDIQLTKQLVDPQWNNIDTAYIGEETSFIVTIDFTNLFPHTFNRSNFSLTDYLTGDVFGINGFDIINISSSGQAVPFSTGSNQYIIDLEPLYTQAGFVPICETYTRDPNNRQNPSNTMFSFVSTTNGWPNTWYQNYLPADATGSGHIFMLRYEIDDPSFTNIKFYPGQNDQWFNGNSMMQFFQTNTHTVRLCQTSGGWITINEFETIELEITGILENTDLIGEENICNEVQLQYSTSQTGRDLIANTCFEIFCSSNHVLINGECIWQCPNGAINYDQCDQCPDWYSLVDGECVIDMCTDANDCPDWYACIDGDCIQDNACRLSVWIFSLFGSVPHTVDFTINTWLSIGRYIDYGDGSTGNSQTHTYNTSGVFTADLYVNYSQTNPTRQVCSSTNITVCWDGEQYCFASWQCLPEGSICEDAICGNGLFQPWQQCETNSAWDIIFDPNLPLELQNDWLCDTNSCMLDTWCGDGFRDEFGIYWPAEQCDRSDPNAENSADCSLLCTLQICVQNYVETQWTQEQCEENDNGPSLRWLVIDRSWSMGSSIQWVTRMQDAQAAISGMLNIMQEADIVGWVLISGDMVWVSSFNQQASLDIWFTGDFTAVADAVMQLVPSWTTNIASWIQIWYEQFMANQVLASWVNQYMIVLSDWQANAPNFTDAWPLAVQRGQAAQDAWIKVYSISVSAPQAYQTMLNLASPGSFYELQSSSMLADIFAGIYYQETCQGTQQIANVLCCELGEEPYSSNNDGIMDQCCPEGSQVINGECVPTVCPNGAINPPDCDICPLGSTLIDDECVPTVCPNGAINRPDCDICPEYSTLINGECVPICPNGATNPPDCDICPTGFNLVDNECVPICPNGAINPPECDICPDWQTLINGQCVTDTPPPWGGWEWTILEMDYCPDGDFSGSFYDGKCEPDFHFTAPIGRFCIYSDEDYLENGPFDDSIGHRWYPYIEIMRISCLHRGRETSQNRWMYQPEWYIQRDEALKTFVRILGIAFEDFTIQTEDQRYPFATPFADVPQDHWFAHYAQYARDRWLTMQTQTNTNDGIMLYPWTNITRFEAVKSLITVYEMITGKSATFTWSSNMTDVQDPSHPYYTYIRKSEALGFISGFPEVDGTFTFRGNNLISRAEFAKIISIAFNEELLNVEDIILTSDLYAMIIKAIAKVEGDKMIFIQTLLGQINMIDETQFMLEYQIRKSTFIEVIYKRVFLPLLNVHVE